MGMSASQARLLSITARMSDIEFNSQQICNARTSLAKSSEKVSNDYTNALNKTHYTIASYDSYGNKEQVALTYNSLMDSSLNHGTYRLMNSNGRLAVNGEQDALYKASDSSYIDNLNAANSRVQEILAVLDTSNAPEAVSYNELRNSKNIYEANLSSKTIAETQLAAAEKNIQDYNTNFPPLIEEVKTEEVKKYTNSGDFNTMLSEMYNSGEAGDENSSVSVFINNYLNNTQGQVYSGSLRAVNNLANNVITSILDYMIEHSSDNKEQFTSIKENNLGDIIGYNNAITTGTLNNRSLNSNDLLDGFADYMYDTFSMDPDVYPTEDGTETIQTPTGNMIANPDRNESDYAALVQTRDDMQEWVNNATEQVKISEAEYKEVQTKYDAYQQYLNAANNTPYTQADLNDALEFQQKSQEAYDKWISQEGVADARERIENGAIDITSDEYNDLFNMMSNGYSVIDKAQANSADWLKAQLENGNMYIEQYSSASKKWNATSMSTSTEMKEEGATKLEIAQAEATYNQEMTKIQNKDKKLELNLKQLDTEHNASKTEYDSVKKVIDENIQRSFKTFSA